MVNPPDSGTKAPETRQVKVTRFELSPSTIISIVLIVGGLWLLSRLVPVILVLVIAMIMVGALIPIVKWFENNKIPRKLAIAIVFITITLITVVFITLTIPALISQLQGVVEQGPALREKLLAYLSGSALTSPLAVFIQKIKYDTLFFSSALSAWEFTKNTIEIFTYTLLTIFLALYIMLDRDRLRGALFAIVPRQYHIPMSRVMVNLETIVGGYIRGQLLTSILMAAFIFILLKALGAEAPLALALFGGAADVLPYIGILLTITPVVLAVLAKGPTAAIIAFILMVIYQEIESRILIPVIYGKSLRLPSSVVLLSLLTGATLMGFIGALLALPVAAAIRMLIIELRVDLPGQVEQEEFAKLKEIDEKVEQEYEVRTAGLPVAEAAAIAVEISDERKREEERITGEENQPNI
jgi:predicted PurR-regulated permease PerM